MSLLSDEEIKAIYYRYGGNVVNCAASIERAIFAKLAGSELPEPAMRTHGAIDTTEKLWLTAEQLRQTYAQGFAAGAASQLAGTPSAWSFKQSKVHNCLSFFRPPEGSYDKGTLVNLYARKEPK